MEYDDLEKDYFRDQRKLSRDERKRRSSKDRSKYKKTDQDKRSKTLEEQRQAFHGDKALVKGRVVASKAEGAVVYYEGKEYLCSLRGALKKEKTEKKNLVTTGDFVLFEPLADAEGAIAFVEPRASVLSRADNLSRRKEHVLAANIDQVLITASLVSPALKPSLIDRYIIAARKGRMTPVVVVNKVDLIGANADENAHVQAERILYHELIKAYEQRDIVLISVSAATGEGMDRLRELMKDKSSVFSGQSGVGKSSLINEMTGLHLAVAKTVKHTRKGSHTTTTARLIPLDFGGFCIDTPGIKSFGVWDLEKSEVESYYSEIHAAGLRCKFPNCSHTHEEVCAVKDAVAKGEISSLVYESYRSLLAEIDQEHLRR